MIIHRGNIKDGVLALMTQLSDSNHEILSMLEDPKMSKYFEKDSPVLNALLDLSKIAASHKVFGKWVAKKVPIIAGIEIAIKETYNAADWYLSFQRITEANAVNGLVMNAARTIQKGIDDSRIALKECPPK